MMQLDRSAELRFGVLVGLLFGFQSNGGPHWMVLWLGLHQKRTWPRFLVGLWEPAGSETGAPTESFEL